MFSFSGARCRTIAVKSAALLFGLLILFGGLRPQEALAGNSKYAAIVIHADTGDVLFDKYSTKKRYPASLTKMMTLYILFEELEAGNLTLETKLRVSAFAAGQPPSKLGVKAGSTISVEKAIEALIIDSSNDIAVVVAEKISGSERNFARRMTREARAMGMRRTVFRNASGLPDRRQYTTAKDLAILAKRVMQDFPQYYPYFSQSSFTFNGKRHRTHNRVIAKLPGATGLKTGYTRASGYNLATAADRDGERLIGIVLGGRSTRTRDAHMISIMNKAYATIRKKPQMLASYHRNPPIPPLKPTTLAALGGKWPPENTTTDTPTLAGNADMKKQIGTARLAFADGEEVDGLNTQDDIGVLLSDMTEAERLNYQNLAAAQSQIKVAQGDTDFRRPELAWSIQIGAYKDRQQAQTYLDDATTIADPWVENGQETITRIERDGHVLHRIRINALTEGQADQACAALLQSGRECLILRDRDISDG